jgi:hypothetical protein
MISAIHAILKPRHFRSAIEVAYIGHFACGATSGPRKSIHPFIRMNELLPIPYKSSREMVF